MADLEDKKKKTTQKLASLLVQEAEEMQPTSQESDLTKLIYQTPSWVKSETLLDDDTKNELLRFAVQIIKDKVEKFSKMPSIFEDFADYEGGEEDSLYEFSDPEEELYPAMSKEADFYRETTPVGRPGSFSTGSTPAFNNGDKVKGVLDGGIPSGYNPMNRARNPDHEEAYGRKRSPNSYPSYSVDNNPGSAKVIPDNKGFANNSSPLRTASTFRQQNADLMEQARIKSQKREKQMKIARIVQQIMKDFDEVLSLLDD